MATSPVANLLATGAACLAVALSCGGADAAAPRRVAPHRAESVALDAASSDVDYKTNTVVFRDIVVTQGAIRVAASEARATGLDFENSEWTFAGNVRISTDGGTLASDRAVVSFRNNRIASATITGEPAQFQQQRRGDLGLARGRAGAIEYDVGEGTVRLSRDAWLSDGRNEITGQLLVYDIVGQRVKAQATAGDAQRVRITIRPRSDAAADGTAREPNKP